MREGRHSHTAAKVARGVLFLRHHPVASQVLPPRIAETTEALLLAAGISKPWHLRLYASGVFSAMAGCSDRHIAPGTTVHMALRKRVVDDEVRAAIADGARQVLVVGAGFDTLAPRLATEHPDVRFVELDHPDTSRVKRAGLEASGDLAPNLTLVAVDLAKRDLAEVMDEVDGWDAEAPTAIVGEGLLMYLPEPAVARFFEATSAVCGAGSTLVFTWVRVDADGRAGADFGFLIRASLKLIGERIEWGVQDGALAPYVADHGWQLRPPEMIDLRERYLVPAGLGDHAVSASERMAVAVR